MKKPASPNKTEKNAKRTPEEKTARKSAKNAGRASSEIKNDRADKKASQKKSLKSAAKQLQKELNGRMNELVTRIRKETKAKLKEVVKEATRRLDGDTERMFEQALHTIVRHYDSVAGTPSPDAEDDGKTDKAARASKKTQTLNKDGSPRKLRAIQEEVDTAAPKTAVPTAAKARASKSADANVPVAAAKRGPKPAASTAAANRRGPKPGTPAMGAKRGPKPRVQTAPAPEATDMLASASNASADELSA